MGGEENNCRLHKGKMEHLTFDENSCFRSVSEKLCEETPPKKKFGACINGYKRPKMCFDRFAYRGEELKACTKKDNQGVPWCSYAAVYESVWPRQYVPCIPC